MFNLAFTYRNNTQVDNRIFKYVNVMKYNNHMFDNVHNNTRKIHGERGPFGMFRN